MSENIKTRRWQAIHSGDKHSDLRVNYLNKSNSLGRAGARSPATKWKSLVRGYHLSLSVLRCAVPDLVLLGAGTYLTDIIGFNNNIMGISLSFWIYFIHFLFQFTDKMALLEALAVEFSIRCGSQSFFYS